MTTLSDAQSHLSTNPLPHITVQMSFMSQDLHLACNFNEALPEQHEGPGGTTRVTRRLWFFCDVCKKPLLSKHALSLHRSKFHGLSFNPTTNESVESTIKCKRGRKTRH
ncbi:protein bric-a-brac 2 [Caerostris extrusa]|uniref:Protein bric-a-brac 2 n=1 Tax=Caerostris extrusa TaxID=172846 RepID=A0AAV4M9T6_CAEEX|nr:protein bric-a-brac 2 [Caerostris extrusa]